MQTPTQADIIVDKFHGFAVMAQPLLGYCQIGTHL
jgi:hypothetical protein